MEFRAGILPAPREGKLSRFFVGIWNEIPFGGKASNWTRFFNKIFA